MQPANNRQLKMEKAFTLIELLVVIAIIGILAGMVVVNMSGATERARIAKSINFASSIQRIMATSLAGEWNFDSQNANDSSGNGNNGTVNGGAVTTTTTPYGNGIAGQYAMSFDGINDYVAIPAVSSNSAIQTFSFWVYIRGAVSGNQYCIDQGGNNNSFSVYNNHFRIITSTSFIYDSIAVPAADRWYFLTKVFDGSRLSLYVDGKLDGGMSASGLAPNAITFGNYGGGGNYRLNGIIDEVRIYNTALAASVIRDQYLAGLEKSLSNGQITKTEYDERTYQLNKKYASNE
ncbi:MAG: LamG-like jellyroll fold domain-containing protein [Candidatus Paceibacterota bacterium]